MNIEQKLTTNDIVTNESHQFSTKELMILNAMKKIKNPFVNLTVTDIAKDLKMGENLANQVFKRDDFPSVNIGKTKTVTLLAYLLWKMERKI